MPFMERSAAAAERAQLQRAIQARADSANQAARAAKKQQNGKTPETGPYPYPKPPFPPQHHAKPGIEAAIDPPPIYDARAYRGSGKLEEKVAIITGGDSGIGRSVAILFAREGADVAIIYLSEDEDAALTKRAVEREGRRCVTIPGDVSDPDFCEDAVAQTIAALGKVDILVNNAAFQQHVERFEDLSFEQFDMTLKTNLYGYFNMARAVIPHFSAGACMINTGSVTGIEGSKDLLDYSMTKGGIHAFTRALAAHLIERSIRVNAVAPGPVWTPLNPAEKDADKVSQFGAHTPMKRPAQPEEIAPAYVFLASPVCSSFITGEILPIIGGYG